ncbi:MAG TPA: AmmeMemoRadiSam system protein B [Bacteroidota bacterium]
MDPRSCLARLVFTIFLFVSACATEQPGVDRQPAVAGQFYPGRPEELARMLSSLFAQALPCRHLAGLRAVIVPHAGYVFSGTVAASGFNQLDTAGAVENIFVLGPSHHVGFEGAAVYTQGNYLTPLGAVEVNRALGQELIRRSPLFSSRLDAQAPEHCVEVEIPFLQHLLHRRFRIVPIVIGAGSAEACRQIAQVLKPYFNDRNLFVISSDFSHYPAYEDAVAADRRTAGAVVAGSPDSLLHVMERNGAVPNLVTSACGSSAILTLLYLASADTTLAFTPIQYQNSGDSPAGGRQNVVGYYAIALSRTRGQRPAEERTNGGSYRLDDAQRGELLLLARRTIEQYLRQGRVAAADTGGMPAELKAPCGAFVTLYRHHELRGCTGRFGAAEPLYKVVREMAIASATQDSRFMPVETPELSSLTIEISVLTPLTRIQSPAEFRLGRDGLYMRKGMRSGTFLPQMAKETGWTTEEFFGHCARDKAGIGWEGWKDAELYTYQALVFSEPER